MGKKGEFHPAGPAERQVLFRFRQVDMDRIAKLQTWIESDDPAGGHCAMTTAVRVALAFMCRQLELEERGEING